MLDDDARTARHGRDETPAHHRHFHLYLFFLVDLSGPAGSRQRTGNRYQGHGKSQEQGSGRFRAEGGTETE